MWCSTIGVIVTLTLSFLAALLVTDTDAQPAGKVYRIGLLNSGPASPASMLSLEAFRQGLRDLGYVEGQHIVLEQRRAEGSEARARELAAELVQLPVDVLVAGGPPRSVPPSRPPARSRSGWREAVIRWRPAGSPAWHSRGGT